MHTTNSSLRRAPLLGAASLWVGLCVGPGLFTSAADAAPPGRMVDVGGHALHLHCTGTGTPVVVLDAGIGASHLDWFHVQPLVAAQTTVCSYDRAGYGYSEAGPRPRLASRLSDELGALLDASRLPAPYVLVGHSFGGLLAQFHASRHADDVAGLVLVDAVHPEQFQRFAADGIDIPSHSSRRFKLGSITQVTEGLPAAERKLAWQLSRNQKALGAMYNEVRNMPASTDETAALGPLPNIPLRVIAHGLTIWENPRNGVQMETTWKALQRDLAARSPRGQLRVAAQSGHNVHLDQPALVAREITTVIDLLRR